MFIVQDAGYFRLCEKIRDPKTGKRRNRILACLGRYPSVEAAVTGLAVDLRAAESHLAVLRLSKTAFLWAERWPILQLENTIAKLSKQLEQVQLFIPAAGE